jgi:hypothetical protein
VRVKNVQLDLLELEANAIIVQKENLLLLVRVSVRIAIVENIMNLMNRLAVYPAFPEELTMSSVKHYAKNVFRESSMTSSVKHLSVASLAHQDFLNQVKVKLHALNAYQESLRRPKARQTVKIVH